MIGSRAATRACLAVGLTWHGHWEGSGRRKRARSGGRRAGTTAVSFFCPAARGDAPVSSFPLADRGGIGWNLGGGRVGCRPGDRVAASSKVQRASPSARVREPMGICIFASRTRQVAGSILASQLSLPSCRITHRFKKLGRCASVTRL